MLLQLSHIVRWFQHTGGQSIPLYANFHSFVHLFIQFSKYLLTTLYVAGTTLRHWRQNKDKRQKSLHLWSLHSSTFRWIKLVKMEPHFSVMPSLLISLFLLDFENIRTTKVLLSEHHHQAVSGSPKAPQAFIQMFPGNHMLTSCSWFSNILHQKPIGRKHLMRDRRYKINLLLVCIYTHLSLPGQNPENF